MLFNSLGFLLFLPIVFLLYWKVFAADFRKQNLLLLVASYFFYACWDWRFLFLLFFSTFLDYFTGLKMCQSQAPQGRKFWFWLSIGINLGFLGFFKYYNFFALSFQELLGGFGLHTDIWLLKVILPVGISFYTFHGLSYVIDIYYGRIKAERNFVDYAVFVSYFPLLVAGPIERATHLLPQIQRSRSFDYEKAVDGLTQMLWGMFKKVVIADNCAEYANMMFNHTGQHSGSDLLLGAFFFTFQIYGDFSGYSDIALGVSRMFGVELLRNFSFPYFSRDIAEFWRRWHISLSTWFRDYLYIPLGGSRGGKGMQVRNTLIIFLVSGFWHGANWTFIVWGLLNALYFMPLLLLGSNRNYLGTVAEGRWLPSLREAWAMGTTFLLTVLAWIFFRADSLTHAFHYLGGVFSKSLLTIPSVLPFAIIALVIFFVGVEWLGRSHQYALQGLRSSTPKWFQKSVYFLIMFLLLFNMGKEQQFIYFQF